MAGLIVFVSGRAEDGGNGAVEQAKVEAELGAVMEQVIKTVNAISGVAAASKRDAAVEEKTPFLVKDIVRGVAESGEGCGGVSVEVEE